MLEFGAQERGEVRTCLRDHEVVDIEELGDAGQRRLSIGVAGVTPWPKGDFLSRCPGYDGASLVLASEDDRGVHG